MLQHFLITIFHAIKQITGEKTYNISKQRAVNLFPFVFFFRNLRFAPEVTSFRESYVFNEILFSLVEEAARALGGNTWYRLLRQHVFNRLGMENVAFVHMDAKENNKLASPVHSLNGKPVQVPMDAYK